MDVHFNISFHEKQASNPVNDAGQVNEDRMPENARYQQPKNQTSQV